MSEPAPGGPEVTVERVLGVPPAAVYDRWFDPASLADWMCPRPARLGRVELDPVVGGRYRFDVEDSGVELVISSRYLALERPRLLRFTWTCTTWPEGAQDSVVTVTPEARRPGATLMRIHHALLPPDVVDDHRHGWDRIGAQLAHALQGPR